MDVVSAEQARIAETAGAARSWRWSGSRRYPPRGGVARMSPVSKIREISRRSHPVMAKCGSGTLARPESGSAEGRFHRRVGGFDAGGRGKPRIKPDLAVPFVCGCATGKALRRIGRRGDDPDEGERGRRHRPRRQTPPFRSPRDPQPATRQKGRDHGEAKKLQARTSSSSSCRTAGFRPNFGRGSRDTADAALCMMLGRGDLRGVRHLQIG